MAINPEDVDVALLNERPNAIPNNASLFPFSDGSGNIFHMTRSQYIAFIAANSGVAKTTLETVMGEPIVIDWQNDIDPDGDGVQTYGQRHGFNVVPGIFPAWNDPDAGAWKEYETNYQYTANGSGILILTIPDTFTGKLTII